MRAWILNDAWPTLQRTVQDFTERDGLLLATSTAYYAAFSFFPLMLVLLGLMGFLLQAWPEAGDARVVLLRVVSTWGSPGLATQLDSLLELARERPGISGPVSFATVLFGAVGVFAGLENAFDRLWAIPQPVGTLMARVRVVLRQRLNAFLMLLAAGVLLLLAFTASTVMDLVITFAGRLPVPPATWRGVQLAVSVVSTSLALAVIYKVLPKPVVPWRDALPGAVLAALTWEVGRAVLGRFVISGQYSSYGAVGAFMALLAWIYYASMIFFLGATFVQATCRIRSEREEQRKIVGVVGAGATGMVVHHRTRVAVKAAYAVGGALLGVIGAIVALVAGTFMTVTRWIRK